MDVHKVGGVREAFSLMLPMSGIIEQKMIVTSKVRNILHCWSYVNTWVMLCIYIINYVQCTYLYNSYWKETKVDKLYNVNDYIYASSIFNEWRAGQNYILSKIVNN